MSNYRRTSKPKTEHIKKGFTVFQKTVATIASILGLITASITIRKTPVQLKRLTLVKKKHSKRKHQNLASRKRKKKIRKQQLRTLLLLLQVNLLLKTKNSPMRQLQKIKAINSH
ncbi:membrane protein [Streptococcus pneumoniae]|nr:membrane protein [Streptococcus pneumoniae]